MDYQQVCQFIYRNCGLLNEGRFEEWLSQCYEATFRYTVEAYSAEIAQNMVWLSHDVKGLRNLFAGLQQHVSVQGAFHRRVGMVSVTEAGDQINATSSVLVYHTDLRGATQFYALATYEDGLIASGPVLQLKSRLVTMSTRLLSFGPHVIL